jgi:transcriptional regulator with XRE-family HTH domain
MTAPDLRNFRKQRGWNQRELARLLGVSQTLVSLWENSQRRLAKRRLHQLWRLGMKMDATELPMRSQLTSGKVDYAQELSNLGYPGFAHFQKGGPNWNPAQLLVNALSEHDLDRRVAEALPWLVLHYSEMEWDWVRHQAKLLDLQNRLGFTLTLARKLAVQKQQLNVADRLEQQERALGGSLLAKQDTYCNDGMTQSERKWLQTRSSPDAASWHVLSDLEAAYLTHA